MVTFPLPSSSAYCYSVSPSAPCISPGASCICICHTLSCNASVLSTSQLHAMPLSFVHLSFMQCLCLSGCYIHIPGNLHFLTVPPPLSCSSRTTSVLITILSNTHLLLGSSLCHPLVNLRSVCRLWSSRRCVVSLLSRRCAACLLRNGGCSFPSISNSSSALLAQEIAVRRELELHIQNALGCLRRLELILADAHASLVDDH